MMQDPKIPAPTSPSQSSSTTKIDQEFLGYLFANTNGSRVEISRATGFSKPTISESAKRLQSQGLITEAGESIPKGRGRRATLYRTNPDYGHSCAIVLDRNQNSIRLLDFQGEFLWESCSPKGLSFPSAISWTKQELEKASRNTTSPRLSASISVAAPVHPVTGAIHPMPGAPLGGSVPEIIASLGLSNVPRVRVDNDVNWAAKTESIDPSKESERTFLYLYLGAGLGGAFVSEGHIVRGSSGAAGEIGFLRTPNGNSLHSELSSMSFGSADQSFIDIDHALSALENTTNREAKYAATLIAHAILDAATILDPGIVILNGPLIASDQLLRTIRSTVESKSIAPIQVELGHSHNIDLITEISGFAMHDAQFTAMQNVTPPT